MMAFAVVVLTTGCNKDEDFMKASLSVEEVTEHSIRMRCAYVPAKHDDAGYILLRTTTDQIDDEVRQALIDVYSEIVPYHDSGVFLCDSLAADRLFYFWAVSYKKQKNGEVTIANIETLGQRTLASNDNRYSYTSSGSEVAFSIPLGDDGFDNIGLGYLYEIGLLKYHVSIALTPDTALTAASEIGENDYYNNNDGNLECTVDVAISDDKKTFTYYAYKPVSDGMYRKYKFDVTVERKLKRLYGNAMPRLY